MEDLKQEVASLSEQLGEKQNELDERDLEVASLQVQRERATQPRTNPEPA